MNRGWIVPGSLLVGAGLAYFLDPQSGGERRRSVGRRLSGAGQRFAHVGSGVAHLGSEAAQFGSQITRRFRDQEDDAFGHPGNGMQSRGPNAEQLANRVRTRLQQIASYPDAIDVAATPAGRVMLSGMAPAHEVHKLVNLVRGVTGVKSVENWIDASQSSLRQWRQRHPTQSSAMTRLLPLLAVAGGGALLLRAARRRRLAMHDAYPPADALGSEGIHLGGTSTAMAGTEARSWGA